MEGKVEKLDNLGRGIVYDNGKVTFVPKTIPGDFIEYKITKSKKNYNEASLINLIKPSLSRKKSFCPHFSSCGGCDIQNLSYEEIMDYKKNRLINSFAQKKININPKVITNPQKYNYRNKISLKISNGQIGFYASSTHNIIPINSCPIASTSINQVIPILKEFNIQNGEIVIRSNKNSEILLIINTKDNIDIPLEKLKQSIKLVGIVLNGKKVYGDDFLYENINNILYRISYDSFFQVNPFVAEKLFQIIEDYINHQDNILDIYCGVGTLSLSAAKKAKSVLGIEIVQNAVLNAIHNAKINKFSNTQFILNDAAVAVTKINQSFDKIIVDPPRAGLNKEVINVIKKIKPKMLIYVSCNSDTLLRDIEYLSDDYMIKDAIILDMFSFTYHYETVCILEKN